MTSTPNATPAPTAQPGRLTELSEAQCWAHLGELEVGRLAYVDATGPVVVPLNYTVRDGSIWLRTASYNQLAVHAAGQVVAFQIDHVNGAQHAGWSVLARGPIEHVLDVEHAAPWPIPEPWADGTRTMAFRVTPTQVTGRALHQADVRPAPGHGPGSIQRG